ncbi:WXG100 family type VII secretion target [Streptomyces sp. ISL-11]|uniref:WXG100 family type VII secretion target n=1 Tax=Streptomyces sp. ISL-11 TaxID=2819174 RepID=UPI001BEC589B|nr:WXG100 family type VII secretion target [Streptomyces sp. ISL-11]MBT2385229.1 WXG100 family type VII secretion target [Streptomyces sp. ISL-11]
MGGKFRLEDAKLTKLANDLDDMHNTIEGRIQALNAVVDSIEGHWKGIAANEYNSMQTRVNGDIRKLKQRLAFAREAVAMSDKGFTQEEHDRLNSFKGVGEGGGGLLGRFQAS